MKIEDVYRTMVPTGYPEDGDMNLGQPSPWWPLGAQPPARKAREESDDPPWWIQESSLAVPVGNRCAHPEGAGSLRARSRRETKSSPKRQKDNVTGNS